MFIILVFLIYLLVSILKLCFFNFILSENYIRYVNELRLGFKFLMLCKDGCIFVKKFYEKSLYFKLICFVDVIKLL